MGLRLHSLKEAKIPFHTGFYAESKNGDYHYPCPRVVVHFYNPNATQPGLVLPGHLPPSIKLAEDETRDALPVPSEAIILKWEKTRYSSIKWEKACTSQGERLHYRIQSTPEGNFTSSIFEEAYPEQENTIITSGDPAQLMPDYGSMDNIVEATSSEKIINLD